MSDRKRVGQAGEEAAAAWVLQQGYEILERNWRGRRGELDLVFQDGAWLVIAEVRTRRSERLGSAVESVDLRKQWRLRRVTEEYLAARQWLNRAVRFDVIALTLREGKLDIRHYPGAF